MSPEQAGDVGEVVEVEPDHTAVRVALWRALHVQADPPPHVIEDEVGLALADPGDDWRERPDMDVEATRRVRASIVARARFVEDVVEEQAGRGVDQYVVLGAGLDTFAQRRPELGGKLRVFEVERPGTQAWKRRRLAELGHAVPDWLHFVPVDFEGDWWSQLSAAGLDIDRPAVVAATGVTMYLTLDAITTMFRRVAGLAPGSTLVTTFLRPVDDVEPEQRAQLEVAVRGARAAGTPFLSFFTPEQMLELGRECGFRDVRHVPAAELAERYFAGAGDGAMPSRGEEVMVAGT
ncbi:class I SAM-dependent methyltransferase [Streptomyces graminifolii]|uniref:class I SAM-dependent methyltransferase n=1 Tax=Streptomyces graminifolii TaxID=1266771 RepID=UPI0040588BDC